MASELDVQPLQPSVPKERFAELRTLTNAELLALIHSSGSQLSSQELLAIHDIANERWATGEDAPSQSATELSREAMLVAIRRMG